jgi:hypothetical protein
MQRAWVVLLASCGFHSTAQATGDPLVDASSTDGTTASSACWTIADSTYNFHVSACPTQIASSIDVTTDVSIDTDGNGNPPGFACMPLASGSSNVCAFAASSITIEAATTLSARGSKPFALLAHAIEVKGTIDVASHIGGQRGPASNLVGCNPGTAAKGSGGGGGGGYGIAGGKGGHEGGTSDTAGLPGTSIGIATLRGGCDGGRGGDGSGGGGPAGSGGAGGGGVWIAADTGMLVIGSGAVINASGAAGARGAMNDHGGYGGGSGGLIVLQAPMITVDPSAMIFANGGPGGGGAQNASAGADGVDSIGPASGGTGGAGGTTNAGAGGVGYPGTLAGQDGDGPAHGGGGGGGGGAGAVRVASLSTITGANVSPPPIMLTP